jgi:uroporphyrin-III C-methyltransferase
MTGKVYLVGAGPGDPELLTMKALRLLRTADAVLHDDLVAPEIIKLASPAARIYNVGKRCGQKRVRQEEINFLMITLAASGLQVVRLKGGDPLIFGRAGEEIEALRRSGIRHEVVPGITSALGAAAAAGIPLTQRHKSSALVLVAEHRADDPKADWSRLVASGATLVLYMPGDNYATIAEKLISAGVSREAKCVLISRATTPAQKIHCVKVSELAHAPRLAAPTLLIVGDVVSAAHDRTMDAGELEPLNLNLHSAFLNSALAPGERMLQNTESQS